MCGRGHWIDFGDWQHDLGNSESRLRQFCIHAWHNRRLHVLRWCNFSVRDHLWLRSSALVANPDWHGDDIVGNALSVVYRYFNLRSALQHSVEPCRDFRKLDWSDQCSNEY